MNGTAKELFRWLQAEGYDPFVRRNKRHAVLGITVHGVPKTVVAPRTPSDSRSMENIMAFVKRLDRQVLNEQQEAAV